MNPEEIQEAAKEATNNQPIYGRKEFTFSAEELQRFAAIIEKRTIERCSELKREALEIFDIPEGMPQDRRDVIEWYDAAIRKLGEQ